MRSVLVSLILTGSGGLLLAVITRRSTPDRWLTRVVLGSYGIRITLAAALFFISLYQWPLLRSLQGAFGSWAFAPDARSYHGYGAQIVEAWRQGIELPNPGLSFEYFAVVGLLYNLLGVYPLYPILMNSWLSAMTACIAYRIGARLFDHRAGLWSAGLVGFWPSSLLWSSLLLKDALTWLLIFFALWLLVTLPSSSPSSHDLPRRSAWPLAVGLGVVTIAVTRLRFYVGFALALAVLLVFAPATVNALGRRRWREAAVYATTVLIVVCSTALAQAVDTYRLLSPAHPERGHIRLALGYWRRGELFPAEQEFRQATALNADEPQPYLGLATVKVEQGHLGEALLYYATYVARERDAAKRAAVEQLIAYLTHQGAPESSQSVSISSRAQPTPVQATQPTIPKPAPSPSVLTPVQKKPSRFSKAAARVLQEVSATPSIPIRPERASTSLKLQPATLLTTVVQHVAKIDDRIVATAQVMSPGSINAVRQGYVSAGGHSLMDAQTTFSDPHTMLAYLPRALTIGFLAPFPWRWFDIRGSTGMMRALASVEMLLLYLLLIGVACGTRDAVRRRPLEGCMLVAFIVFTAVPMCLAVANLGTLFRLRLQFMLPMLVLAAGGHPLECYRWLLARCTRPWMKEEADAAA